MHCQLCGHPVSRPATWPGRIRYRGQEFGYLACQACGSLRCDPMPGPEVLQAMYGAEYAASAAGPDCVDDPKQPERCIDVLREHPIGTFVDFESGSGQLLRMAADLGWTAIGVELDAEIAAETSAKLGVEVHPYDVLAADPRPLGDVLHLGDVIEHLTDLDSQFPIILKLLRPGGVLIAQGPLEANANLFSWLVRLAGHLRPGRVRDFPPWHVLLATARGQRTFFSRYRLDELAFEVWEVDWPAPSRLTGSEWLSPRHVALHVLRRVSATVSRLGPGMLGNRYSYVGRIPGLPAGNLKGARAQDGSNVCAE